MFAETAFTSFEQMTPFGELCQVQAHRCFLVKRGWSVITGSLKCQQRNSSAKN